jgi:hypothetical protein
MSIENSPLYGPPLRNGLMDAHELHTPKKDAIELKLYSQKAGRLLMENLFPQIAEEYDNRVVSSEELVNELAFSLADFADKYMMGLTRLAYDKMPEILDVLITDPTQRSVTLKLWEEYIKESKINSENESLSRRQKDNMNREAENNPHHKPLKEQRRAISSKQRQSREIRIRENKRKRGEN